VGHICELTGYADAQDDASAARPLGTGRHGLEGPLQMAGNNGDVGASNEHADAVPEGAQLASAGACAFGEEDIAARLGDEAMAEGVNGVVAAILPPHGEGVDHAGGEGGDGRSFEEGVAGREGEDAISQAQRQGGRQDQDIKVAGVVGDHNERRRRGEMLASEDLDAFSEPEDTAHPPPPEIAADQPEQTALAFYGTQTFGFGHAEILGGFILPFFHSESFQVLVIVSRW